MKFLKLNKTVVLRETHLKHAPLHPNHKVDNIFVPFGCASAKKDFRVTWVEVDTTEEVKPDFETKNLDAALVQTSNNLHKTLIKQRSRAYAYVWISCLERIQLFRINSDGPIRPWRKGILTFLVKQGDVIPEGFMPRFHHNCTEKPIKLRKTNATKMMVSIVLTTVIEPFTLQVIMFARLLVLCPLCQKNKLITTKLGVNPIAECHRDSGNIYAFCITHTDPEITHTQFN